MKACIGQITSFEHIVMAMIDLGHIFSLIRRFTQFFKDFLSLENLMT
ncbi:MAG: hypothetical protein H7281_06445 [Bacteriovorax sp.]|nr:hypothetical protein [Bacteriovorax sp.]